ncbi:sialate O-acetylesterase [Planctomicrobium sp. SH664]|uniref:sialate O-acetylesterase n=1 Tax=Planctomicrobium sp. SH664 TaxID=3448125 RepID=UPI003F5BC879
MMRLRTAFAFCGLVLACSPNLLQAEVRLPSIFGSGMVLQREQSVPVWGTAQPGEEVTVTFRDQKQSTKADAAGKWKVALAPLSLGEPATLTVRGENQVDFTDVLVGEVWLCGGQSNMTFALARGLDGDIESRAASWPEIRLFQVPQLAAETPQSDVNAKWRVCDPKSAAGFSAVGYFFGRDLHKMLNVPVGLIQSAYGGTTAEAWTPQETIDADPVYGPEVKSWKERAAAYDPAVAKQEYEAALKRWEAASAKATAANRPLPAKPRLAGPPRMSQNYPANLYNGMIAPIQTYGIRGAIWYQGESNGSRAREYQTVMPNVIASWRKVWGQGDFPFYQVELANYRPISQEPGLSQWAELREAQQLTTKKLPNVGSVCITDLGAAMDIHPKDKLNVAKRLARLVLHDVYGFKDIAAKGPTVSDVQFPGARALVTFDLHGGGKLTSYYNERLKGFAVAGEDQQWKWAEAKIVGDNQVEVWNSEVLEPVAVRYNWADNPQGNLYSDVYLPASPFRTDRWPGTQDQPSPPTAR